MKNILVTTDLSEGAAAAYGVARQMAAAFQAKIELLAIIEDPAQAALMYALDHPVQANPNVLQQLIEKIDKELKHIIQEHFAGLGATPHVQEAREAVHAEIINFAKLKQIDLIIIATHGQTGLSRLLIGSVAERVVRSSSCPVLTVPLRES